MSNQPINESINESVTNIFIGHNTHQQRFLTALTWTFSPHMFQLACHSLFQLYPDHLHQLPHWQTWNGNGLLVLVLFCLISCEIQTTKLSIFSFCIFKKVFCLIWNPQSSGKLLSVLITWPSQENEISFFFNPCSNMLKIKILLFDCQTFQEFGSTSLCRDLR